MRRLERAWRWVADYLGRAPGTFVFFFVIMVVTLVLRGVDAPTATRLLRRESTNLVQMSRDAPRVLFLSAFLLDGGRLWRELLFFNLVLCPLERWAGTYRWLAALVAGHVGASIATTLGIWFEVRAGAAGRDIVYPVDVGPSYAVRAAAGAVVYRLPRPLNWVVAGLLLAMDAYAVASSGSFTDWGHMTALLIGFAVGPLLRPASHGSVPATSASRVPSSWEGWRRWIATPPGPTTVAQQRRLATMAAWVLFTAAATATFVAARGGTDVAIAAGRDATATVVGPAESCGHGCLEVPVRYDTPRSGTSVLHLPAGTTADVGTRLPVRPDPTSPGALRVGGEARRIDVSGLLGEIAVTAAAAGAAILVVARRRTRPTEADIAGIGGGG